MASLDPKGSKENKHSAGSGSSSNDTRTRVPLSKLTSYSTNSPADDVTPISDVEISEWRGQFDPSLGDLYASWSQVISDKKYFLCKRKEEGEDIYAVKGTVKFENSSPEHVFTSLHHYIIRRSWDMSFSEMEQKLKISETDDILYSAIKYPFPLNPRDSLQIRSYRVNEDKSVYVYVYRSTVHSCCPGRKGFVRTSTMGCFYIIKDPDNSNKTTLHLLMRSDPKGAIPTSIINTVAPIMARKWLDKLYSFCESPSNSGLTTEQSKA